MEKYRRNMRNLQFIVTILLFPFGIISYLIPLRKDIWIFGSWNGQRYSDNSKYLYEYLHANKELSVRPIWLTKNKKIYDYLNSQHKESYMAYSLRGIYYSIISGVAIMSVSWIDFPFTAFIPKRKKLVQLWHGTPLRKHNLKKMPFRIRFLKTFLLAYIGREYDLVTTANKKNADIHSLKMRFNIPKEKIKVTGQPRTDIFFDKKKFEAIEFPKKNAKVILYLPTWRKYSHNLFDEKYKFNFKKINDFLKKNNAYLIIKVHNNEFRKYQNEIKKYKSESNIKMIFIDDIYPIMPTVDMLIADFSSVHFDFMLIDKPLIYLIPDFDKYNKACGFHYDYSSITPGPKVADWNKAMVEIKKVLKGEDEFKEMRRKVCKEFNEFHDGKNSKRTYDEIKNIL